MGTKEVGIYLINKQKFENTTKEQIIKNIMGNARRKYNLIDVEEGTIAGYNIKVYNHISTSPDLWSKFFNCKVQEKKLIEEESLSNNFIAFIYNSNNLFCVTTNRAYNDIQKYIIPFYGVCVMSHFIKSEDKIRSATYNNIMSNFLGGSEYLGEEYQATLDKYWDRLNTKLMAEIDKERLYNELNLQNKRKKTKVRCDAKDNFTICSKITLDELIQIIQKLDEISNNELIDKFNTIERVKEDKDIQKLEETLVQAIFSEIQDKTLDVCIVHKSIDLFFNSMSYKFMYNTKPVYECDTIPNSEDMLKVFELLQVDTEPKTLDAINHIILLCRNSDGDILVSGNIKDFLNINIEVENKNYIFQNNMWYKLSDNYIETLNVIFETIINNYKEGNIEFGEWDKETETEYIDKYNNKKNFYKIHPRLEDGIEICDLMYIDRENKIIKMLFLKKGFGASTRDLAIQTTMGVKRFNSLISDETKLEMFYRKYIEPKNKAYRYSTFKKDVKTFLKNAIVVYKLEKNQTEESNIGKQSIIFAKNEIELIGKCKFTMKQL